MRFVRKHSLLVATGILAAAVSWAATVRDVRAPEPAVLTGSLTNSGSSAAAFWKSVEQNWSATTGYGMPTSPYPCPKGAADGSPCHTASASAGTPLYGRVRKNGNWCRCEIGPPAPQ